jgi:hypothetical protein
MIFTQIIIFLVILVLEITLLHVIIQLLELKSLSSEPVNRARDQLLLDILA